MKASRQMPSIKMKAIFLAAGSDGDIHPHLAIGRELLKRGHDVLFVTTLNYVDLARECGFEALSCLGWEDKAELEGAEKLGMAGKLKAQCRFFTTQVTKICKMVAVHLDDRSILIAAPFGYTMAKMLHVKYKVPYVSTALAPSNILCSLKNPPSFESTGWYTKMPYSLRKLLVRSVEFVITDRLLRFLLKKVARNLDMQLPPARQFVTEWLYSSQKIVGLFGNWFSPRPEDWPVHISVTGFPLFEKNEQEQQLSTGLSQFLDQGAAPVVFTAGTDTETPQMFFEAVLKVAQALNVRGVFLTRLTDQLPQLPNTVWHESYTSLQALLPKASVVVHHGGIGTMAQAMRAGTPQLILPVQLDQFDNGQHLEQLGCGLVQRDSLDGSAIIEKLKYLLTAPQVRDACRTAQILMEPGMETCSRAVDAIEETFKSSTQFRLSQKISEPSYD